MIIEVCFKRKYFSLLKKIAFNSVVIGHFFVIICEIY